uniref:Uncharacterized protein n=1 Tax=Rhizophora mucronata TaxID=61149 RepID=A0A2P2Q663_RHIMU
MYKKPVNDYRHNGYHKINIGKESQRDHIGDVKIGC